MKIRFNILSPNNTGSPDYNICGQASSEIDSDQLAVKLTLNGSVIFNEPDCSGILTSIPSLPHVAGNRTLTGLACNGSNFVLQIDDIISPNTYGILKVEISKNGYQSFTNTFKLFDYDLGQYNYINPLAPYNTNPNFDFYLVKNQDNLDYSYNTTGIQTKAFSKVIAYRRPFTDEIHFYNAVGTQGQIYYEQVGNVPRVIIGTGDGGIVCAPTGMSIRQTINVEDIYNQLLDTCQDAITLPYLQWTPKINVSVNCFPACNETCISTIATGKFISNVDVSNLACINVDDVAIYPYHNSPYINIVHTFYDYQGNQIAFIPTNIGFGACGTQASPNPVEIPLPTLPDLGDVVIRTDFLFMLDNADINNYYVKCSQNTIISRCNWYTITETDTCGEFKVSNCSVDDVVLTIKQLQDDKTLLTISTTTIKALDSVTINLQADGVYTFEVPSKIEGEVEIYTVINDCILKACLFDKLGNLICGKHDDTCIASIKNYYDFNAFVLNLHSYYALLNEEYNFNYIYKVIDIKKLNDLYTIKQYLDNLATYCVASCDTCNCGK